MKLTGSSVGFGSSRIAPSSSTGTSPSPDRQLTPSSLTAKTRPTALDLRFDGSAQYASRASLLLSVALATSAAGAGSPATHFFSRSAAAACAAIWPAISPIHACAWPRLGTAQPTTQISPKDEIVLL